MQWRLESKLQKLGIEEMEIFSHNVDEDIESLEFKESIKNYTQW